MNNLGKIHAVFLIVPAFCLGIILGLLGLSNFVFLVFVAGAFSLAIVFFSFEIRLVLLSIFLLIGFIRADWWIQTYGETNLNAGKTRVSAYVSAEPDYREFHTRLTLTIDGSYEKVLVTLPHYPEYRYGDLLYFDGVLVTPESFETDQGRVFDYKNFLLKDKIYFVSRYPEITLVSEGTRGSKVTKTLLDVKRAFIHRIEQLFPEPHSSLLGGLLVGAKASMGPNLLDQFRQTGVIHIVVLSGFNVTIIAEAIMRVLAFIGVLGSTFFGSVAILLFTIMTGASATVVRAALMAFLVIIARATGYESKIIKALFFAAFMMILHNPMILLYDPSFQLSFLATLGLIVVVPWIDSKLGLIPRTKFDLRGLAAASIGTQIFVLPMLVWMSGEISLVSPLVNILVLWIVPLTMLLGFIVFVFSYISINVALPLILSTWILLGYILMLVDWFSQMPFSTIKTPHLSVLGVVFVYVLYFLLWMILKKRN